MGSICSTTCFQCSRPERSSARSSITTCRGRIAVMTPWLGPTGVPGVTINPFPVLSSSAARGCSRPKTTPVTRNSCSSYRCSGVSARQSPRARSMVKGRNGSRRRGGSWCGSLPASDSAATYTGGGGGSAATMPRPMRTMPRHVTDRLTGSNPSWCFRRVPAPSHGESGTW